MRADAEATKLQGQKANDIIVSRSVYQLNGMRAKKVKSSTAKKSILSSGTEDVMFWKTEY